MFGKEALALKPHGLPESPKTRHHLTSIVKSGMSPACVEVSAYRSRSTTLVPALLLCKNRNSLPPKKVLPHTPFGSLDYWVFPGMHHIHSSIANYSAPVIQTEGPRPGPGKECRYIVNSGMACTHSCVN